MDRPIDGHPFNMFSDDWDEVFTFRSLSVVTLLALVLVVPLSTSTASPEDQFKQIEIACPSAGVEVVSASGMGQTFKPVTGTITAIGVFLESRWGSPVPLTIKLHRGSLPGQTLLSGNFVIGPGSTGWFYVNSSTPIQVDPGREYSIEVRAAFGNVVWHMCDGLYDDGVRIVSGSPASDSMDFMIRVYGLVPDISLSLSPGEVSLKQGERGNVTVTVASLKGFRGEVQLSLAAVGGGPLVTLSNSSLDLDVGGSAQASIGVEVPDNLNPGSYTVTVTAAILGPWGTRTRSATVTINVEESVRDFTLSVSPTSASVRRGGGVTFTVDVGRVGSFDGPVSLRVQGLGSGFQYSLSQNSQVPPFTSFLRITTSRDVPLSAVTFTVVGEGSGIMHDATASLSITEEPGFTISLDKRELALTRGERGSFTISVIGYGGFVQPVILAVSNLPQGCSASLSANGLSPSYQSIVTIAVGDALPGNYTLGITASSGGITKTSSLKLAIVGAATSTTSEAERTTVISESETAVKSTRLELHVAPTSLELRTGESGSLAISVTGTGSERVTFSLSGLPPDANHSFNPPSLEGDGATSLLIRAGSTPGRFTGVVVAEAGERRTTHVFQLNIRGSGGRIEFPWFAGAAVILVAVVGTALVLLRGRRRAFSS